VVVTTPISLPPTTRTIWASAAAKAEWEPIIQRATSAWHRVERESVPAGIRRCAQQWISVPDYLAMIPWAINHGLAFRVMRFTGSAGNGFLHTSYPEGSDQVVVAFGRVRPAALETPEKHFGYPPCCVRSFERHFPLDADPAWPWAHRSLPQLIDGAQVRTLTPEHYTTSPLLRYLGVRAVPHIPCGDRCKPSAHQAKAYLDLMANTGDRTGADETRALLRLPTTWDRYRGVAIVTTPHFRIVATSAFFPHKEVIHVAGV
jgi:hypothetical protein